MSHSKPEIQRMEGSLCTCGLGCLKDVYLYFWRKRRDALDLWEKFEALRGQVDHLCEKWKELDDEIERLSITVERSSRYENVKESVSQIQVRFKEIDDRYEELCGSRKIQSPTDVERPRPRPRQKTGEMMWRCTLFAFARLHAKVGTLKADASEVMNLLNLENLIIRVRPVKIEIPSAEKVDIVGHPHKQYFDRVLKHIDEENCKIICIYGMASGVGVSNIMKNINNYFLNPSSICKSKFECVIWVAIREQETSEKIIESIQKEIQFRMSAPAGETRQLNSQIITSVLGTKRYLLLLDDFPPDINLEDIGIPAGGKIVMSTKCIRRLRRMTQLDEEVEVKKLSPDESSYMFKKLFFKKSKQAELSEDKWDEVHLILKELDGILVFIKMITATIANRQDLVYWQGVRQELEADVDSSDLLGTAGINKAYKEAYATLNENWKQCLLFLALYPKHYVVPRNHLVECWKAHNFLRDHSRFQVMRAVGEFVCVTLEERCLLERACEKYVKLPLMFRKVAITLLNPEQFVIFPKDGCSRQPWCSDAQWVSGAQSNIEQLPVSPQCDGLSALLLPKNPLLTRLENALFPTIPNLLVLDLHGTGIQSLPLSISSLTKLRCLYLNECRCLEELPEGMVHLTDLEVLDIRNTRVHCSPRYISLLSLKCMRISYEKKRDANWETPNRLWSSSLEELAIEFAKGVERNVVDSVREEVIDGFGDRDFKINLDFEFESFELYLKKDLGTADSLYHLSRTTHSPSTLGLKSNHNQPPPSEHTSLNQHSDNRVSVKGKEIVEEGNGELHEVVRSDLTGKSSTSSNQFSCIRRA